MTQILQSKELDFDVRTDIMRAAIIESPGIIGIREVKVPEPRGSEVRIRIEGCGVCASNIPVFEGREWFNYPLPAGNPGHEAWGIIDKLGPDANKFKIGTRVSFLSGSAYSEYDVTDENNAVELPDFLEGNPFPGEPLGCAMNIFKRSDIKAGQTVAIVGVGFLGALLIQLAKAAGAHVIAISRRDYSLEIAKEQGADYLIKMDDHWHIINQVKALTDEKFCDRVIECVGLEWPLNLASEITKVRGKLIIAGYHQDGMRNVNVQLWNWRGIDVINAHERDERIYIQGINEAVAAVKERRLNPFPLFTHLYEMDDLQSAFNDMISRNDSFLKGIMITDFGKNKLK